MKKTSNGTKTSVVRDVAQSSALRAPMGAGPAAAEARSLADVCVARGVEFGGAGRLANTPVEQPSWRAGWDLETRRFVAHKWRSEADDGGNQWRIVDMSNLVVCGYADSEGKAAIIADALEYLSLDSDVAEFEPRLAA